MTPKTKVLNLATNQFFVYNLPPERAVTVAYFQYTLDNWEWWDYDSIPIPPVKKGKYFISCGDYTARLPKPNKD